MRSRDRCVANADDLYSAAALRRLAAEVQELGPDTHVIIGYRLRQTILTTRAELRGASASWTTAT